MANTRRYTSNAERLSISYHEAGHAVAMIDLGQPFRYVTMRPRDPYSAGQVMSCGKEHDSWLSSGAIYVSGIIAEYLRIELGNYEFVDFGDRAKFQRYLTQYSGRTDLKELRRRSWGAWFAARTMPDILDIPVDLNLSPVDISIKCWNFAFKTLVLHWKAVELVASELYYSTKLIPSKEIRCIVNGVEKDWVSLSTLSDNDMEPWFLKYSRLKWMPSDSWFAEVERYSIVNN
jgi:hypothetical protein